MGGFLGWRFDGSVCTGLEGEFWLGSAVGGWSVVVGLTRRLFEGFN